MKKHQADQIAEKIYEIIKAIAVNKELTDFQEGIADRLKDDLVTLLTT